MIDRETAILQTPTEIMTTFSVSHEYEVFWIEEMLAIYISNSARVSLCTDHSLRSVKGDEYLKKYAFVTNDKHRFRLLHIQIYNVLQKLC